MSDTETNVVICGHSRHGKSTVAGRFLIETQRVPREMLERIHERAAVEIGDFEKRRRDFNPYSLLFLLHRTDTFKAISGEPEDSSRTVVARRARVTHQGISLQLIDNPGHEKYIDNIAYGIHLADAALLTVDAKGSVEEGTWMSLRLLRALGVPIVGVMVTRMDLIDFGQKVFEETASNVRAAIEEVMGVSATDLPVVPVAALEEDGFRPGKLFDWYRDKTGPLDLLVRAAEVSSSQLAEPLRVVLAGGLEIYTPPGAGTVVVGTVECGVVRVQDELILEPASTLHRQPVKVRVRSLQYARSVTEKRGAVTQEVKARGVAALSLDGVGVADLRRWLRHGGALGPLSAPPRAVCEIKVELLVFEKNRIFVGRDYTLLSNAARSTCRVIRLEPPLRPGPTEEAQLRGTEAEGFQKAGELSATLLLESPIFIESVKEGHRRLSRFALRQDNRVVACGRCLEVVGEGSSADIARRTDRYALQEEKL